MGAGSIWHWVILLLIVVILFGRGKISEVMGDVAKGIKSFKKGMADDDDVAQNPGAKPASDGKTIDHQAKAGDATSAAERSKAG
ncbi:MAG: twin-arginine translocase TatA/TatE family subunit [Hyphomicrobium sp.]